MDGKKNEEEDAVNSEARSRPKNVAVTTDQSIRQSGPGDEGMERPEVSQSDRGS